MARILAYTSPARGHLFPLVPMLDELRARGHEIALRTLASQVAPMRARGFDAGPIDPAIEAIEHDDHGARNPREGLRRSVRVFAARGVHDARDLSDAIEDVRPDALLVDINAWGALAVAERHGAAWAAWCPYPLPLPSRDAPPFGPGLPPARGPLGRVRDRVMRPLVFGTVERAMRPGMNEVRSTVGVAPLASAADLLRRPPLLLYTTAEPFEYPRSDWPDNVRMVGACDWDPPAEPPAWLAEVEGDIVLVTTSSEFQDDGELVRCALEGLAGEADLHVVVTLPALESPGVAVPANARVLSFAPHAPILDRAVCAVTHGGMGATQKALARGVPVCAVPFGRDQFEVARRVEMSGAGTRLPAKRLSPERLRAAVREAIAMREGAARVAAGYRATGGAGSGAVALEQLLAGNVGAHLVDRGEARLESVARRA